MLKKDPIVRIVETLHNECAGCLLREYFIDLKFVTKLPPCGIVGVWDFDNNIRVDLVDE